MSLMVLVWMLEYNYKRLAELITTFTKEDKKMNGEVYVKVYTNCHAKISLLPNSQVKLYTFIYCERSS